MTVLFIFRMMYEPGEGQRPQFETEARVRLNRHALPVYKDRIVYNGQDYIAWDIKHFLDDLRTPYEVTAIRKVNNPLALERNHGKS